MFFLFKLIDILSQNHFKNMLKSEDETLEIRLQSIYEYGEGRWKISTQYELASPPFKQGMQVIPCSWIALGKTDEKCIGKWWKATVLNALPMRAG